MGVSVGVGVSAGASLDGGRKWSGADGLTSITGRLVLARRGAITWL